MKASQLIALLQSEIHLYGDLDVTVYEEDGDYGDHEDVTHVEVISSESPAIFKIAAR